MEDAPNLPYLDRLIREVFRWQPAAPLAIPHACYEDDQYRGYRIPKGTPVIGNVWAITRDESVYPEPEVFNPDRFLDSSVPLAPGFGWGRRLCPGIHLAQSSIFIIVASILATFNVVPFDETILPTTEGEKNSIVYRPKPFKCKLVPRTDQHRSLINSMA
ncbi:hypothetical protein FS749_006970 [Ceratobasidium sp. UAMH 11750]|nr:hypothetical protein FS749_006970 [Ceratobasidium sp. UAMH 11750]